MIPSPCNKICKLDSNNICIGCKRTINEITQWSMFSDEGKLTVLERINDQHDRVSSTES